MVTEHPDAALRKRQALAFLVESRKTLERAKRGRLHFIQLARTHGLTYVEIGDALGITEAGVRAILSRAEVS